MRMKTLELLFVKICRIGIGLAFAVLIAAVLVQVVGRVFQTSPLWTEELTRYALLYVAAFGAGLSLHTGDLVNVDVLCESLKGKWPRRLRLVSAILVAGLCAALLLPAWKYVSIGAFQTSPALGVRMDLIHLSVFILLVCLFAFAAHRAVAMILGRHNGLPTRSEARV